jgi:hypothetical protein
MKDLVEGEPAGHDGGVLEIQLKKRFAQNFRCLDINFNPNL